MRTTLVMLSLTTALSGAQTPTVTNGQTETRRGPIAAALSTPGPSRDAVWLAWRVPLVAGDRELCSNWVTDRERIRGLVLEGPGGTFPRRATAPTASPVNLDAGTTLVVLVRAVEGRAERVRTIAADCPIDANGQTLRWLADVTPAESLTYLESLVIERHLGAAPQNIHDAAISAIALHHDNAADPILDRLTGTTLPASTRATAARWLAIARGEHGFDEVSSLIRDERDARTRATYVSALSRSPSTRVSAALLTLARSDADPGVRSEAASGYARVGPAGTVEALMDLLAKEAADDVRARIVASLDLVPGQAGLPALLNLAGPGNDARLRREAVRALGRSTDPRAIAYLENLLRQ